MDRFRRRFRRLLHCRPSNEETRSRVRHETLSARVKQLPAIADESFRNGELRNGDAQRYAFVGSVGVGGATGVGL